PACLLARSPRAGRLAPHVPHLWLANCYFSNYNFSRRRCTLCASLASFFSWFSDVTFHFRSYHVLLHSYVELIWHYLCVNQRPFHLPIRSVGWRAAVVDCGGGLSARLLTSPSGTPKMATP